MHKGWKSALKVVGIVIGLSLLLVLSSLAYFNLPVEGKKEDVRLGVTYSDKYARELGLDWRQAYKAILDDLHVQNIRLVAYWDEIEKTPGEYNFEVLDWQLEQANARGINVVLAIGQRVPRWPECHIPAWARGDDVLRKDALIKYLEVLVKRYSNDHPEIAIWQVESEPFLPFFGNCPRFDEDLFSREVNLVRSIDDSRPILTTDSGELSLWFQAAQYGDQFGTTMYRDLWKENIGYFRYPLGPNFFRFKSWYTEKFTDIEKLVVIELQGEPWASGWLGDVPLEEQFQTMNPSLLRSHVEYAKSSGFSDMYLWGAEWWYWLKEQHESDAMWQEAKALFSEHKELQRVSLNGNTINVFLADTPIERQQGLSGKESLGYGEGMLFVFDKPQYYSFWMKDMNFAIDIIWMDENFEVIEILHNISPDTYPKLFTPKEPAQHVLETPSGWAQRNSINRGDVLKGVDATSLDISQ